MWKQIRGGTIMTETTTNELIKGGAFLTEDLTPDRVFTPEDFSDEQVVELLVESFYDASFEDMEWEEMDDDVAAAHAHHNHDHKHWKEGCNCWDDC